MTISLQASADGTYGSILVGGNEKVRVGSTGIAAGSYAPNSITATEIADGALIETSANAIGYGTGSGGTVTQATSKSTSVTLNKPTGQITMNNAALAAGAVVSFTLANSLVTANDIVPVTLKSGTGTGSAYTFSTEVGPGGVVINVRNNSGGALAEALVLNFSVIKGVAA